MKVLILSLVLRTVVIIAVLCFTFAMFYVTKNYKILYLLFLLLVCFFIPTYSYKEGKEDETK